MKNIWLIIVACFVILASCNENPYERDVDSINVDFKIAPFYKDILDLSKNYSEAKRAAMFHTYGPFFESFNSQILKIGVSTDSAYAQKLSKFLSESWIQDLYAATAKTFADSTKLQTQLQEVLQYYSYYFPEKKIPLIVPFIGAVQYSVVLDSGVVAIGLDKYLGSNFEMYKQMQVSSFVRRNMIADKIPSDFARAIVENDYPQKFTEDYLLAEIIQNGRYMYFVKSMCPNQADTVLWGYTAKQLAFCQKSEGEFWKYFVSTDNLLFSSDYMIVRRFIDDGPFTPVFTKECPARIGQWIGFKIVESFMKNNPKVTLKQLFEITSAQEIMGRAKYNP